MKEEVEIVVDGDGLEMKFKEEPVNEKPATTLEEESINEEIAEVLEEELEQEIEEFEEEIKEEAHFKEKPEYASEEHENMLKQYLELFLVFFKIGAFTFGGGFAMIPLIEKEVVDNKKWIHSEDIIDVFAISQSIPGAIAINTSTLIGRKIAGKRGALCATFGVILPSFIIITIIASFFSVIADSQAVASVFVGINAAVILLIFQAAKKMMTAGIVDKVTAVIFTITVLAIVFTDITPIVFIILGAIPGIVSYYRKGGSWL